MPTTYAHWRFGDKCIKTLPKDYQDIINNNRAIFDYGVHGPDIFFYYNCLKSNEIVKYGDDLHNIPFKDTLVSLKENYHKCSNKDAALAYLFGFLCHFTLDSYSHGFVERMVLEGKYAHLKIEAQLDKHLLKLDGYNPIKKSVTFSLKPSRDIGKVLSELFPQYSASTMYKVIRDQKFYLDLIKDDSKFKRDFLIKIMNKFNATSFMDLLLMDEDYPDLYPAMLRLTKLADKAVEHYPKLAKSLLKYLNDADELDIYFRHDFGQKKGYEQLPVLSLEEEKSYQVNIQD